jgi:hypothetical protein
MTWYADEWEAPWPGWPVQPGQHVLHELEPPGNESHIEWMMVTQQLPG